MQKKNITQVCLRSDEAGGQVIVVTFDQNTGNDGEPGTILNVGSEEVTWVVNSSSDVETAPGEFEAEPESNLPLPDASP